MKRKVLMNAFAIAITSAMVFAASPDKAHAEELTLGVEAVGSVQEEAVQDAGTAPAANAASQGSATGATDTTNSSGSTAPSTPAATAESTSSSDAGSNESTGGSSAASSESTGNSDAASNESMGSSDTAGNESTGSSDASTGRDTAADTTDDADKNENAAANSNGNAVANTNSDTNTAGNSVSDTNTNANVTAAAPMMLLGAGDTTETDMTLSDFIQAVIEGNGTFDGNGKTVKWEPDENSVRIQRIQSNNAQYGLFKDLTDLNISNVNFEYIPANIPQHKDAWNTTLKDYNADRIRNAEFQLLNIGNVIIKNCNFEKVMISPFGG